MIGELLSTGRVVSLPEGTALNGFPRDVDAGVVILLPFGRVLAGQCILGGLEQWLWGKPGDFPWKEVALFPGRPLNLSVNGLGEIVISSRAVRELRNCLLSRAAPPGDHFLTVKRLGALLDGKEWIPSDPAALWRTFLLTPHLRIAYWGVRFGLLWGGADMIERIGVWLRYAPRVFEGRDELPRLWSALSGIPSAAIRAEMGALGFAEDRFFQLRSGDANPAVFRSEGGYLLHYLHEGLETREIASRVPFRSWLFLPTPLWERLRTSERVPLREILLSWWGCAEAREAEAWFHPYRISGESPLSLGEPLNVT